MSALCLLLLLGVAAGGICAAEHPAGFPLVRTHAGSEIGADPIGFAAVQDGEGVLYVGSRRGVLRFDGESWTSLPLPGAMTVRGLDVAADGRLWVGGFGELGWFEPGAGKQFRFHSLRSLLPEGSENVGEIWHVFADAAGGAVFFADDRILRWNGRGFTVWTMPGSRRLPAVRLGDALYFHHLPTGLHRLSPQGPVPVIPAEVLGDAAVLWIELRGADWLLGTSQGLYRWADGRLTRFAPAVSDYLTQHRLTSGAVLPGRRYAFGTYEGGIVLMSRDGELDGVLTEREGLPSRIVRSLHVDRGNQLWVMSTSSISRINLAAPTRFYDQRAGLPAQPYHAIAQFDERVVVAGERGVFEIAADGVGFTRLVQAGEAVYDLRRDQDGLLVAAPKTLLRLRRAGPEVIHTSLYDVFAGVPSVRPGGELYLFDHRSLLVREPGGRARVVVQDLPDYGRHVVADARGDLWLELMTLGVRFARPAEGGPVRTSPVPAGFGLPSDLTRTLVRGRGDGTVFIGGEQGAWVQPPGAGAFLPVEGWPKRLLTAATEFTPDGTLWTVHPATDRLAAVAGRVEIRGARVRWEARDVPGLAEIGSPRSAYLTAGAAPELWIGGTRSVLRHPIAATPPLRAPARPLLHAVARIDEAAEPGPIRGPLPYRTRGIVFSFAAPQFATRDALRLETRIEGLDTSWVAAGPDARRELTAVREGRYRFAVRAVAASGAVSAPAEFAFEVLPPWWRTAPALLGALVAVVPLGYGIYRLRVRALRRRNQELEARVRQRTEELEAANRAKTEFVANMSHDIRNPLNGIVGLTLALEDSRLDPRQREIAATLRDCTTYLSSLVDDVLDFASIEAGRIELRPGAFAPGELLRSIVATLQSDAVQSGAALTVEVGPDVPPHLQGDAGRIQQILVNFVSNALKYAGGHVELVVGMPADAPDEVEFSVRDHGPGIGREDQAALFTKFTRLRQRHGGEAIPGTGLGLAACRLLADAMGGAVGVTSEPGRGARFFLRLPAVAAAAPAVVAADPLADAPVLLVEDTDYNAWAASAVLARLGLACERAATGEQALQLFAAKRFNVVLLDRNLPDMDGTEVARRMRELESGGNHRAVLLAVTAYCTAQDRELCLQAGMDAFVGKPLTPDKLRRVLAESSRRLVGAPPVHLAREAKPVGPDFRLLNFLGDGTPEGLERELRRFLVELDEMLELLAPTAATGDLAALAELAHRLLNHTRVVEASALAGAATRLDVSARSRDQDACAAWLARVQAEAALLRAAILQRCPTSPSA